MLLDPVDAFEAWAFEHGDEVMAAQDDCTRDDYTRER